MTTPIDPPQDAPFRMSRTEFVALIAMMLACVAFSIDAMLPALPQIGVDLSPDAPERAPLILSTFLLGMGLGTFFMGPLSDAFGRKQVILGASALYIAGAVLVLVSQTIEMVMIARVLQGLGAAGPRVVSLAIVRDRYSGRQMAQVASVVMMIFTLVPAVAPLIGAGILHIADWRGIFVAFITFISVLCIWMMLRLPETLPAEKRRPLRIPVLLSALREMATHRIVRLSVFVQMLVSAMLFLTLMLVHQTYDHVYGRGDEFPYWFFGVAIVAGSASLLNALLVIRLGMHRLIVLALGFQIILSGSFLLFDLGGGTYGFYFFVFWQTFIFFQAGLTIGNLNAIAMEPMGHIAGMAASVIGAFSTVGAVLISGPIGTMFNGSEKLLVVSVFIMAAAAFAAMMWMGRLMRRTGTT